MEIAKYIVVVLYVIVCVALIILATIQNKEKSGDNAVAGTG